MGQFIFIQSYGDWRQKQYLNWDVYGYYQYLPAFLIYKDAKEFKYVEAIEQQYYICDGRKKYGLIPLEEGGYVLKFSAGMSLAYLPWFSLAHIYTKISNEASDGFSVPYHQAINHGMMIYLLIGFYFLAQLLKQFTSIRNILLILICIYLGTNLFHYSNEENGMSHLMLFSLQSILLYFTWKWHQTQSMKSILIVAVCVGWSSLIRPTEFLTILIPFIWGVYNRETLLQKWNLIKTNFKQFIPAILIVLAFGCVQLFYWKWATGDFFVYSYKNEGNFTFSDPKIWKGLFSFRKGLFIYTPLMLLPFVGLIFTKRNLLPLLLIYLTLVIYVTFCWNPWWYGGSFGMRAMIQHFAILSIPFAYLLNRFFNKKIWRNAIVIICFLFVGLNLFQTWQYNQGIIHWEQMNKKKYFDALFKVK